MKERNQKEIPTIIDEINEYLGEGLPEDREKFTVEGIAEEVGVSKNILYEWLRSDVEFTTSLGRLKEVQQNDAFKTGTDMDTYVNVMMIFLLVTETRDRHYEPTNI